MPPRKRVTEKQFWNRAQALERVAELHGAVFEDDTPQKRAARKAQAILHPEEFDRFYLPHYFTGEPAEFHKELYAIIERDRLAAVEAARGHAKSTVITFAYTTKQVATGAAMRAWNEGRLETEDPLLHAALVAALIAEGRPPFEGLVWDPFIVLGSCTSGQAEDFTTAVKVELEQNSRLIGDWGELVSDPGRNYADFVTKSDIRVLAVGMRDSRRGVKHGPYRPTLWIIDDPDDEKTIGSERIRRKQIKYVTGMVRPAMDPVRGRVFIIANETHPECVVATIYRDQLVPEREQRFSVWAKYQFNARGPDGSILWEARFPARLLDELEQEDPEAFQTEYMNNPASTEDKPFKALQYYSRATYSELDLPKVGGLDPALGKTRTSDYQALVYIRYSPRDRKVLIHRAEFKRLPPPDLVVYVNGTYAEEQPVAFVVEAIGFQLLLVAMMASDGSQTGLFPSYETIESQTDSKDVRIRSLAPLVRTTLLFPDDGSCRQLEKQFLAYPDGKKDGPDIVEMIMRIIRRIAQGGTGMGEIIHHPRRFGERKGGW